MKTLRILTIAAAASMMMVSCGSSAQKTVEEEHEIDGVKTMQMDGFKATWIRDNAEPRINPISTFPTASDEDKATYADGLKASMSTFLVEKDGKTILFDTGLGKADSRLIPSLDSLGYTPADIDYVYITHLHGDHIGGLAKDGKAVFENAELYLGRVEYEAWMAMDDEKNAQQKAALAPYADKMHLFEFGDILPLDVEAIDAIGHTPGHTAFLVGNLLIAGDIMHGVEMQIKHPEVNASFDMDQEQAAASRAKILALAKEKGYQLCGMHFPEPGFLEIEY